MSGKKKPDGCDDDTALDTSCLDDCCKKLEECEHKLKTVGAGTDPVSFDPATILTIIAVVKQLVDFIRSWRKS